MTETSLKNLHQVHEFLISAGWRIARSTLYSHLKQKKIGPNQDGRYSLGSVELYARHFLRRQATGRPIPKEDEILQERKARLEVERLEEEVSRARLKHQVEEAQYIHRDLLELELAARAAVLDAGLDHFFQSNAETWIAAAGGNQGKLSEFMAVLMAEKTRLVSEYLRPMELP